MKVDLPDSPVPIYKKGKQLINAYKEQNHFTQQQRRALRNKLVWHYEEKLKQDPILLLQTFLPKCKASKNFFSFFR